MTDLNRWPGPPPNAGIRTPVVIETLYISLLIILPTPKAESGLESSERSSERFGGQMCKTSTRLLGTGRIGAYVCRGLGVRGDSPSSGPKTSDDSDALLFQD